MLFRRVYAHILHALSHQTCFQWAPKFKLQKSCVCFHPQTSPHMMILGRQKSYNIFHLILTVLDIITSPPSTSRLLQDGVILYCSCCQKVPWKHQNQQCLSLSLNSLCLVALSSEPIGSYSRPKSLKTPLKCIVSLFFKKRLSNFLKFLATVVFINYYSNKRK